MKINNETLTRQSLPSEEYLLLLGTALSVFSSNNGFIIGNILKLDSACSWYELVDKVSGKLIKNVQDAITVCAGEDIEDKFSQIVNMRNRIIHGFRITNKSGEQVMATRERNTGNQIEITNEYLIEFIKRNDELSQMLHELRGF